MAAGPCLPDPRIEAYFREEIRAWWEALQAIDPVTEGKLYIQVFRQYCRLLDASSQYAREGRLPDGFSFARSRSERPRLSACS